ncbi:type II toxin-antitoxin system RelE/ParE family toxin [Candidatus Giovannonibacteria bacterium]|nr:type II toxin-antitoxin system RelE/ParE family toxin [Candidatus Giovannonibacteria bacterium]
MAEIRYTEEFLRRYKELPLSIQKKAERREKLFHENPYHSSLKTEKLQPAEREYWSFRVDRNYRIIFRFGGNNTIYFITCGHHNWIYRYLLSH